jgi:hypothetical protein
VSPTHIIEALISLYYRKDIKTGSTEIDPYFVILIHLNSSIRFSLYFLILSKPAATRISSLALAFGVPSSASNRFTTSTMVSHCIPTNCISSQHQIIRKTLPSRRGSAFGRCRASIGDRRSSLGKPTRGDRPAFITAKNQRL